MTRRKPAQDEIAPGSLVLVHFIEQQLEGWTFARGHWPLHITLVPWFATEDEEAVTRALDRLTEQIHGFTLAVGPLEPFGPHGKRANTIANPAAARELHKLLLKALEGADVSLHSSKFIGEEFRPHISRHEGDGRHSNEGERVLMSDFHLVKLVDKDTCEVYQAFELTRR